MNLKSIVVFAICAFLVCPLSAATIEKIRPENRPQIEGKEIDWIDGDYFFQNDLIAGVIAHPTPTRDANMTTRGVGAGVIDLTRRDVPSDQLTAFYPAGGRFAFNDDSLVTIRRAGKSAIWSCQSSSAVSGKKTKCNVEYRIEDGQPFLTCTVRIQGEDSAKQAPFDSVRADRTFKFSTLKGTGAAFCEDEYFRQTYGFQTTVESDPKWTGNRAKRLSYPAESLEADDDSVRWTTRIYPASSSIDLLGLLAGAAPQTFQVRGMVGDQPRIQLSIAGGDIQPLKRAVWRSAADGKSVVHLQPGTYTVRADAIGHQPSDLQITVTDEPKTHQLKLGPASTVTADISSGHAAKTPCKVSFYSLPVNGQQVPDPNFGLDSQDGSVGNTVYSADGTFVRSIPPGRYEAVISYGPEFDAVFREITVTEGENTDLTATLHRVVDTKGWVSAELHSHSSPSGDNTSSQLGRVENLLCEHLEFAPCTEHQRVEAYDDQLEILNASELMATCSGMELTGTLLPINHQNAFPLKLNPYAQDGGGPRISGDPIKQIARLAMWDDNADKVVQTNHPNMRQMLFDKDLDGSDDGGYSKMLDYMDVIEVHPLQDIFVDPASIEDPKQRDKNRIRPWLDLIKSGRRIPGVVNTDAHYNWHGSGWLRNWVRSSTDDPAEITTEEMIKSLEAGRIVMSTGPFMTVRLEHSDLERPAEIGDAVTIGSKDATVAVQIQCPNWLDINRVEVFVDGKMQPELSRRRTTHPGDFGDDLIKFDQQLPVKVTGDTFIVVAAIGEKQQLGRVMGTRYGQFPPVVVSNPIFVKTP